MNNTFIQTNAAYRDPTHTTTLRAMFARDLTKRFRQLRGLIKKAIVDEDCFGLKKENDYGLVFHQMVTPGKKAFNFPRSSDKVQAFMLWLREQMDDGILEVIERPTLGPGIEQAWTNLYIKKSYESGIIQARANLKKAGYSFPDLDEIYEPSLPFPEMDYLDTSYVWKDTLHMDRVGLLYTRTYNDLRGITNAMDGHISRVLAQGMADGKNPLVLAILLNKTISGPVGDLGITDILGRFIPAQKRAKMLARTEIIRAHASATVQEYRRYEIEGIYLRAEWSTVGGACEECIAMEARNPYKLNEIDGKIPFHPNSYSDDTEIYTENGWKSVKDVYVDERCLSLNPDGFKNEFVSCVRTYKHFEKKMILFSCQEIDLLVTKDHNMFCRYNEHFEFIQAKNIIMNDNTIFFACKNSEKLLNDVSSYGIPASLIKKKIIEYNKVAYCVELKKFHTVLVRRNGKATWCGNCRCTILPVIPKK